MSTYSVYDIKIDNELSFTPGPTAGNVLSINADGTTEWIVPQGGSSGGLVVDFIGIPTETFLGDIITLTASTIRDISTYEFIQEQPVNVFYPTIRFHNENTTNLILSKTGTHSISLLQGDIASQTGGLQTKQIIVTEKVNPEYVYTGGRKLNNKLETHLFKSSFPTAAGIPVNTIWAANNFTLVNAVAIDTLGNIYIACNRFGPGNVFYGHSLKKFDSSGNILFSIDVNGNDMNSVAVDTSGNIYVAGNRFSSSTVSTRKYDTDGDLIWSVDNGRSVNSIAVDASGNVYTAGQRAFQGIVTDRKYDTNGNLLWSVDHGSDTRVIAVDASGNVYTGGNRLFSNDQQIPRVTTRKYDTDGNLIWSVDHGSTVFAIAVDASGNVYTGGNRNTNSALFGEPVIPGDGGQTMRKYDSNGVLILNFARQDSGTSFNVNDNNVNGIAIDKNGFVYNCSSQGFGGATLLQTGNLRKFDSANGSRIGEFSPTSFAGVGGDSFFLKSVDTFPPNKGAFLS